MISRSLPIQACGSAVVAICALTADAVATDLIRLQFSMMHYDWNPTIERLSIEDGNTFGTTSGSATRLVSPLGAANFFAVLGLPTDRSRFRMQLTMLRTNTVNFDRAGTGQFRFTDMDGDEITGAVQATTVNGVFSASLTNVFLNPLTDGLFDGPVGGSWSMAFSEASPFVGDFRTSVSPLLPTMPSYQLCSEPAEGVIRTVPTPGSILCLGLAGVSVFGRRRRG